jgi:hypothetical protein
VWFIGSAIAVGLGIAAAVWYASRTEIAPAPTVAADKPTVEQPAPIAEPAAPPTPQLVEVRFESAPSAAVFAGGNPSALCHTPCTHSIDPKDGGSPDRRSFVVRTDGHQDASIVVDLKGTQRAFAVTLAPREEPAPEDVAEEPAPAPEAEDPKPRPGARPRPARRPTVKPRPDDQASTASKPDDKKAGDRRPDDADLLDPTAGRPAKKPAPGPIDPTDTLDPFRQKKP